MLRGVAEVSVLALVLQLLPLAADALLQQNGCHGAVPEAFPMACRQLFLGQGVRAGETVISRSRPNLPQISCSGLPFEIVDRSGP